MTIRTRILAVTMSTLLLTVIVTTTAAVFAIQKQSKAGIARYRMEDMRNTKEKLKNLVDIAYATIESNHRDAQNREFLEKVYGRRLQDIIGIAESIVEELMAKVESGQLTEAEAKQEVSEAIRKIRYDNGTGYVWINDVGKPYPKMVMHPFSPELEGKILDDPKYNCAQGKNVNLFQACVDICEAAGEGFVDYRWPKPTAQGLTEPLPKLTYVRLIESWGWVLGSGVYIDNVLVESAQKSKNEIRNMRYDQNAGYFWINDMGRPYPTMVMHPLSPELDGKPLDNPTFNCALGKNENLFVACVNVCVADGEGFVDYRWPKPSAQGLTKPEPKLSYVRLYEPLGWIVGTGVYLDGIDANIRPQTGAMTARGNDLITESVLFSAFLKQDKEEDSCICVGPGSRELTSRETLKYMNNRKLQMPGDYNAGSFESKGWIL